MADVFDRLKEALAERYAIEREIGSGGMATVYLAEDLKLHRKVALKVLKPDLAAALGPERFLQEVEIAAKLHHPHILPLHDSGEADGFLYYVMPYEGGQSLREKLAREGELPISDAVRILRDVVDALAHAHSHNVVHRDIKPDNVMLSGRHALVTDFGVAKAVSESSGRHKLTTEGIALGTPAYMAPEQAAADPHIDHRADIYAVGAVAYELLTGRPPFTGGTQQEILAAHVTQTPEPVTKFRESVSPALEQLVMKCLEKKAADRWQSAEELLPQLEALATPSGGTTPTAMTPVSRVRVGNRALVLGVAAIAVFAFGLAGLLFRGRGSDEGNIAAIPLDERPWVIVAAFEGQSDEPGLLEAARANVMVTLDQSELVMALPDNQLRDALRAAGRADTTLLDNDLALELAVRNRIAQVVEGRVDRVGETYSIILRLLNAEDGTVSASASETAEHESELMFQLAEATAQLFPSFAGDRASARAGRAPFTLMTPSFEAFKLAREGDQAYARGEGNRAAGLWGQALELDPDFAYVWNRLGDEHANWGRWDSTRYCYEQALLRRDRLDERTALNVQAKMAMYGNDLGAALRIYETMERLGRPFYNNHALVLGRLRRFEDAVEMFRRAGARLLHPSPLLLNNMRAMLLQTGDFDEAREVGERLDSLGHVWAPARALEDASLDADWARLERLAEGLRQDPAAQPLLRSVGWAVLIDTELLHGRTENIPALSVGLQQTFGELGGFSALVIQELVWLSWYSEGHLTPHGEPSVEDSSADAIVARAILAASAGDTTEARQELATLTGHPECYARSCEQVPAFIQAVLATQARRWQEVVDSLGPGAANGYEYGLLTPMSFRVPRQWLVAEAYRWLGRPDSAASYYERVADRRGFTPEIMGHPAVYPFVHRRLAQMYGELGENARAAEHWNLFLEVFTDPDPELEYMVTEARQALAELAREG